MVDETGPWFFAFVEPTETTFTQDPHARVDMYVFSVDIEHKEGDNCTATLEIENPGVGLLASGRLSWLWIAKRKANTDIIPLFFGQLLSIPNDLLQTVIKVTFVARSINQTSDKLALAQTLKVLPYYDPIWVDVARQNDPEAVLDGYSSRWHFNRTTLATTISDVLAGEDGTITFTEDELYYDGMNFTVDTIPLSSVNVRATIGWSQHSAGTIDMGAQNIYSYTGDGIISDWPKPYSSLGEAWTAGNASALDVYSIQSATTVTSGFSWKNGEKTHENGDLLSVSESVTESTAPGISFETEHSSVSSVGFPPMSMVTQNGATESVVDYPGSAASFSAKQTKIVIPKWLVSTFLEIRYDCSRDRKEVINFSLATDVQDVLILPGRVKANPDKIDLNGRDVGLALFVRATLRGTGNVSNGDEVLISNTTPYVFQSTLTSGEGHVLIGASLAASLQNLVNAINVNGTGIPGVDYATENQANSIVSAAVVDSSNILLTGLSSDEKVPIETTSSVLIFEAPDSYTYNGSNPTNGQTVVVGGVTYTFDDELAIQLNQLTQTQNIIVQTPYHVLLGVTLEISMINLAGAINADGGAGAEYTRGTLQNTLAKAVVVNGILTVYPRYAGAALTVSGSWSRATGVLVPDQNTIPIEDLSRSSFFPTTRGLQSVQALVARARAKARISTRAVKATFDADFEKCLTLSCRQNAVLNDLRFPGGQAAGKIISYFIKANGDTGAETAGGEVGCAVGNGGSVSADPGTNNYVDSGYVAVDFQEAFGQQILLGDVWFSPPVGFPAVDDGLLFPLSKSQAVLSERIINDYISQEDALQSAWARQHPATGDTGIDFHAAGNFGGVADVFKATKAVQQAFVDSITKHHVVYELILKPLNSGPFSARYDLNLSLLKIPQQVDLAAA